MPCRAKYQKNVEAYHNKSTGMKPNIVPNCIRTESYMITFEVEEEKYMSLPACLIFGYFSSEKWKRFFFDLCPNWTCISFSGFRFSGKNISWNLRMTSLLKTTVWFISLAWSGKFLSFRHTILVAGCQSQRLSTFLLTCHFGVKASFFSSMTYPSSSMTKFLEMLSFHLNLLLGLGLILLLM